LFRFFLTLLTLASLIPRAHLRAAKIDTVEEEMQCFGREAEGGLFL